MNIDLEKEALSAILNKYDELFGPFPSQYDLGYAVSDICEFLEEARDLYDEKGHKK